MSQNYVVLTMDQDWCHTSVLEETINIFESLKLPATVFVTDFTQKWSSTENLEWGVHPNFAPDSTQGLSVEAIILKADSSVENCTSWRSHSLFTSTKILDEVSRLTDWKIENNFYSPKATKINYDIFPGTSITRIPLHWEDDLELRGKVTAVDYLRSTYPESNSVVVFNFHPIHLILNSESMQTYNSLKVKQQLNRPINFYQDYRNSNSMGIKNQLLDLVDFLQNDGKLQIITLKDLLAYL
jgi:hypothetical protein